MSRTFLLLGAGYSAQTFAARALTNGDRVVGTTRSAEKMEGLRAVGIDPLVFDGMLDEPVRAALKRATHLVVSIAPGEAGDPGLDAVSGADMPDLQWIGYLSTVGVYGDHGGAWVDEESPCRPVAKRSARRLEAEGEWTRLAAGWQVPLAILRLSGIYGPGRNAFVNLERGTARRIVKPGQVFNRIHVDDIAGALAHLSERLEGGVFNVTDDEPAPPQEVVSHAARLMGVAPPPEIAFDAAEMTAMARSFYGESKRVSNARLKASGFVFGHPTYRHALDTMWRDGTWKGPR
jgi:nucleoside-diphosphate-sugar epimerase